MAPHNDTISRRSFLRRTSAGVSGLLIASSLPLPLKGAEKSGSAEGTDRTEAYSDTWLSDSVPTPPQRLSRLVHTLADTGFSGVWGRELKDPDWDFSEVSEAGVDAQILYGRAALSVARNAPRGSSRANFLSVRQPFCPPPCTRFRAWERHPPQATPPLASSVP